MSQRVLEEMTPGEEADITSHSRSSSRSRFSIAANGSNPATLASPMSEPGPRKGESPSLAKSLWLRRSHSTKVPSSLHAARPSVPGTLETSSSQEINSSSSPPLSASHLASLGASSPHPRSAPAKRQPASRSSHGIETFNGPPPALSTQRSYTTDVTRRRPAPPNLILNRPSLRGRSHTDSWIDTNASRRSLSVDDRTRVVPWIDPGVGRINGEKTKVGMDSVVVSHQSLDDDTDRTLCSLRSDETSPTWRAQGEPAQPDENSQYLQDDQHPETTVEDGESKLSQEDLFLNLAKSDTLAHDAAESSSRSESKSERRRSRVSISTSQQPSSPQQLTPRLSSSGRKLQGHLVSSSQDSPRSRWSPSRHLPEQNLQLPMRNGAPRDSRYAAQSSPVDMGNGNHHFASDGTGSSNMSRIRNGWNQGTTPDGSFAYGGRQPFREPPSVLPPRAYRQSNLSYSTNGRDQHFPISTSPEPIYRNGKRVPTRRVEDIDLFSTEPLTVWETIDLLKYRISNLGRLGPRGKTGNMITTPLEFCKVDGDYTYKIRTDECKIHPELRAALAKSKSVMESKFYRALEATTLEALTLAGMTGSVVGLGPPPEDANRRHLMRQADKLCRTMTELCLVLSEERSEEADADQGAHEDQSVSFDQGAEEEQRLAPVRASSEEPENRTSSRINRRTEARRRSMVVFSSNNRNRQQSPFPVTGPIPAQRREYEEEQADNLHYGNGHHYNNAHYHHRYPDSEYNARHHYIDPPYNEHHYVDPGFNHRQHHDHHHNEHHHHDYHQYSNHHYYNDPYHARPVSRAATDIGTHFRPSPLSRRQPPEYAPSHPPPTRHQRSPSVQSAFSRRSAHFPPSSPLSHSMTPNGYPLDRQCLDCYPQPPPQSLTSSQRAELAEIRKWRLDALAGSEAGQVEQGDEGMDYQSVEEEGEETDDFQSLH